jgi:hypothetical protein
MPFSRLLQHISASSEAKGLCLRGWIDLGCFPLRMQGSPSGSSVMCDVVVVVVVLCDLRFAFCVRFRLW